MEKPIITPAEYKRIKERYEEAKRQRAAQMKRDGETMNQTAVAERWGVHAAIVIRALRTYQPEQKGNIMDKEWVIAGKVKGTLPEIGKTYEIRDVRKGTYTGRIMNVRGEFADVEVTDGLPRFAGFESRLAYDGELTIRAGLVYLIEKHPE